MVSPLEQQRNRDFPQAPSGMGCSGAGRPMPCCAMKLWRSQGRWTFTEQSLQGNGRSGCAHRAAKLAEREGRRHRSWDETSRDEAMLVKAVRNAQGTGIKAGQDHQRARAVGQIQALGTMQQVGGEDAENWSRRD